MERMIIDDYVEYLSNRITQGTLITRIKHNHVPVVGNELSWWKDHLYSVYGETKRADRINKYILDVCKDVRILI